MLVSVVIPARDEARGITRTVEAVLAQRIPGIGIEVVVVDDGSSDDTAAAARQAGARVIELSGSPGNPGAARNRGAEATTGDPIVFLDADCEPRDGWLYALMCAHAEGARVVGGAIEAAPGQKLAARCNHYCAFYHAIPHGKRRSIPNHMPANLSVRRAIFAATSGFSECLPEADGREELMWQAELKQNGHTLFFEPAAIVEHHYRPGWLDVFRRNYRWAFSAIRSKTLWGAVRFGWLYKQPILLIMAAPVLVLAHTAYTAACWARAGVLEPLFVLPALLAARVAYGAGLVVGGVRWLAHPGIESRPFGGRWR
jgi:glycosyltransferase involved in cell wall biosynthesis